VFAGTAGKAGKAEGYGSNQHPGDFTGREERTTEIEPEGTPGQLGQRPKSNEGVEESGQRFKRGATTNGGRKGMTQPDYFETLKKQKVDVFKEADKRLKARIRQRADDLTAAKPLPRYLLRALESGDLGRVEACIDKAMGEGWTADEISLTLDKMNAHVKNLME
jgi:hypothetical protein